MTLDERFLLKLYELAMESGDPFAEVDFLGIAQSLGQRQTAVKTIVQHLAKANFIKKIDETRVYLTRQGCDFVLEELEFLRLK